MIKSKSNIISNPAHYLAGRSIQPIDVIEGWALCHHLACVVKYVARAGRKNPILEDLKKAEWYLSHEVEYLQESYNACSLTLMRNKTFKVHDVCDDWQLSDNLSDVLNHVRTSKVPSLRKEALREALKNLRAEIERYEEEEMNQFEEFKMRKKSLSLRSIAYLPMIALIFIACGDCLAATSSVDTAFKDIEGLMGGKLGALVQICAFAMGAGASIVASKVWPVACASLVLVGYNGFSGVIKTAHTLLI